MFLFSLHWIVRKTALLPQLLLLRTGLSLIGGSDLFIFWDYYLFDQILGDCQHANTKEKKGNDIDKI